MLANAFVGHEKQPTKKELSSVLGQASVLWDELVADLKSDLELDGAEWNSYSVKAGWSLRLKRKKRNILYLGPRAGCFLACFVLGAKAVAVARKSQLPSGILKMIANAKRYAEGTAVRIEVRKSEDAEVVRTLARIKIEN